MDNNISTIKLLINNKISLSDLNKEEQEFINILNLDNIKRFEQETGFFSHKEQDLEMFDIFVNYFKSNQDTLTKLIDLKNDKLSYKEFKKLIITYINIMIKSDIFANFSSYDWIEENLIEEYKEIFIDKNAPEELKKAFYSNSISLNFIYQHKEYLPYLVDKNIKSIIKADIKLNIPNLNNKTKFNQIDFISEYTNIYGNKMFLELCAKYGNMLSNIQITSINDEINNPKLIEKLIRKAIVNKIINGYFSYRYLENIEEFKLEYPDMFINLSNLKTIPKEEQERLTEAFYKRQLTFMDIKKYKELAKYLKTKNLKIAFGIQNSIDQIKSARQKRTHDYFTQVKEEYSDLELLDAFGNDFFLSLCFEYGRYLEGISLELHKILTLKTNQYIDKNNNVVSENEIKTIIETIIEKQVILGKIEYFEQDAPQFLIKKHPEIFLDKNAPDELKKYFYNYNNNYPLTFKLLKEHKEWQKYLKEKSIKTAILRSSYYKEETIKYFNLFGTDKAIKLGINKAETVMEMITSKKVELMKEWYDKTGQKFIPDFTIMKNFPKEQADKFLLSAFNWSKIAKNKNFFNSAESKDAILKLSYSFGVFESDKRGYNKVEELLTSIPKVINFQQGYIIKQIDNNIAFLTNKDKFLKESKTKEEAFFKIINYLNDEKIKTDNNTKNITKLLEAIKKEKIDIDFSQNIFEQIYRKKEDNAYFLTINQQEYPKTTQAIRNILEEYIELPILTPNIAHQLFGGFELKYDPDFREFLLKNIEEILTQPKYASFISNIQKQFSEIKSNNSNRTLTLDLAVSYVQNNKYESVNIGNENVATISAIAGYSQEDFNILQQIYNYGKQRTFSSIPRIEKTIGKYSYEMLRLDDPLAMAIGTLTDCCQALGDMAEMCMQHSMIDNNGRVFVIKDSENNIVAQSWVWRNKDVLCFDNIEIPTRALKRATRSARLQDKEEFTEEIFNIYKQAAHQLIEKDEQVYKQLLEAKKITQEQYEGLRLGKITVGIGYNDIAKSIKEKAILDKNKVTIPLPFEEKVELTNGLYTKDSTTQYILEKRDNRKEYELNTLPIYNDLYIEYNDDNFKEKNLLTLEKLEIITKKNPQTLEINADYYSDKKQLVTEIAHTYSLNPKTTKIIMNSNFAIIYEINKNKLKIADLFFNTKVDNKEQQIDITNKVIIQIRLALDQIRNNRQIDITNLNKRQKEIYYKALNLTNEIDIERGISHGR